MNKRIVILFALLMTLLTHRPIVVSSGAQPVPPTRLKTTPDFRLKDTAGMEHTLKALRGQVVVLYFFCPCPECHRVAALWGQAQPGLPSLPQTASPATGAKAKPNSGPPLTVVVFAGEAADARSFRDTVGLDAARTVMLTDSDSAVAQTYDAIPCPRVFVLDANGILRYTNRAPDAKSSEIEPATVVSRVMDALQSLAKPSPGPSGGKPKGKK